MPKASFEKDFRWRAKPGVVIVYAAGKSYPVTTACLAAAVRAGAIVPASGGTVAPKSGLPLTGEMPSSYPHGRSRDAVR